MPDKLHTKIRSYVSYNWRFRCAGSNSLRGMAGVTRLELAASGVTGRRSNQTELHPQKRPHEGPLLYARRCVVSTPPGVKMRATPAEKVVGDDGIEPPTPSV